MGSCWDFSCLSLQSTYTGFAFCGPKIEDNAPRDPGACQAYGKTKLSNSPQITALRAARETPCVVAWGMFEAQLLACLACIGADRLERQLQYLEYLLRSKY